MDAFEKAQKKMEKEWEKQRKREEREAKQHSRTMTNMQSDIARMSTIISTTLYQAKIQQQAYETEIDLDINDERQVYDVCRDFEKAFHSELCFYNGREKSMSFIPMKQIKNGGITITKLHISGRDSVKIFEDVMRACGYRVIVKFQKDGSRENKNLSGFQYDGKGQLRIPNEKIQAPEKPADPAKKAEKPANEKTPKAANAPAGDYKKSATEDDYFIGIQHDAKVVVSKDGSACDNTKAALREVAEKVGFEVDPKWNTQQFGSKLVDYLNGKK